MGNDEEDLYLQKLNDFVFDEDKIITFAWLSRELKVGPQKARELLKAFVKDHRSLKPNDLSTSWILSGVLKETGNITVCVAREQEVEVKKDLFDPLVSELIYSVQKAKEVDLNVISMVDNLDINKDSKFLVVGRNCIKRNVRVKFVVPETQRVAPVDKTKASHLFGKVKVDTSETQIKTEKISPKNSTVNKDKISPKNEATNKAKKGGLANFFTKGPVIKPEVKPKVEPKEEVIKVDKEEEKQKTEVIEMEKEEKRQTEVVEVEKEETQKRKTDTFFDSDTDEEAQKVEARNKRQKVEEKMKPKATKRKLESSTERAKKKRKRIVQKNDSDSDDMFVDDDKKEEDDENIVLSDNEEMFPINVPKNTLKPKNKRRKQVEKNFMDEDGYMITKKEWISVSASESSEEEKEQKNPQTKREAPPPKKVSPPKPVAKGKKQPANQKTLMDFFKKK